MRISGSVYWGPFWGGVLLTLHRYHFTFVNGVDTPGGPVADTDVVSCDLDWVVSAAHVEAWLRSPARMQAAAATGLQSTRQAATAELQRQGYLHRLPVIDTVQFDRMELWSLGGGNYSRRHTARCAHGGEFLSDDDKFHIFLAFGTMLVLILFIAVRSVNS